MIGPDLLGWAGPHVHTDRPSESGADIAVLMGDGRFDINVADFRRELWSVRETVEDLLNEEDEDLVREGTAYYRHFRVAFPVGSLDISDVGEIEYSTRTVVTLCIGLTKFFKAMTVMVQSELHACATPTEVVRKCAELATYKYPSELLKWGMYWRGMKLRIVLRQRIEIIAAKPKPEEPYIGLLPAKRHREFGPTGDLQGDTPFRAVVEAHTREDYGYSGYSFEVPENTFLIRAFSEYEQTMGRTLIGSYDLLKRFSEATGRAMMPDAIFFICTAGDSLEEWVDGEVFSVPELAELIEPKSMTGMGWWNWI